MNNDKLLSVEEIEQEIENMKNSKEYKNRKSNCNFITRRLVAFQISLPYAEALESLQKKNGEQKAEIDRNYEFRTDLDFDVAHCKYCCDNNIHLAKIETENMTKEEWESGYITPPSKQDRS